jgi:hypothetical protein
MRLGVLGEPACRQLQDGAAAMRPPQTTHPPGPVGQLPLASRSSPRRERTPLLHLGEATKITNLSQLPELWLSVPECHPTPTAAADSRPPHSLHPPAINSPAEVSNW